MGIRVVLGGCRVFHLDLVLHLVEFFHQRFVLAGQVTGIRQAGDDGFGFGSNDTDADHKHCKGEFFQHVFKTSFRYSIDGAKEDPRSVTSEAPRCRKHEEAKTKFE